MNALTISTLDTTDLEKLQALIQKETLARTLGKKKEPTFAELRKIYVENEQAFIDEHLKRGGIVIKHCLSQELAQSKFYFDVTPGFCTRTTNIWGIWYDSFSWRDALIFNHDFSFLAFKDDDGNVQYKDDSGKIRYCRIATPGYIRKLAHSLKFNISPISSI